jgi:bisanhydrobacterioruberin hydratase
VTKSHATQDTRPHTSLSKAVWFLGLLHAVGFVGFQLNVGHFERLVPLHLIVTFIVWLGSGEPSSIARYNWLLVCGLVGFGCEVVGVTAGVLFGNYTYGETLGPKLLGVPIIMGINWALLTELAHDVSARILLRRRASNVVHAALGACLLVILDVIMEPFAIRYDLWDWEGQQVPLWNYACWWLVSFALLLLRPSLVRRSFSSASVFVYCYQLALFALLLPITLEAQ